MNFLLIPNTALFIEILLGSVIWHKIYKLLFANTFSTFLILLVIISVFHFGALPVLILSIIIGSSFLFATNILKISDYLLALIVGFSSFVSIFTLISLISSVDIGYYSTMIIYCLQAALARRQGNVKFYNFFSELNVIDWSLIIAALIFGSLPQLHWDAVQANLYIAKWYVLSNSLGPIKEAITSLFPQSAIVYFSLFYKIGGLKLLQLSFFLPFLMTLLLIKKIINQSNIGFLGQIILYLSLSTPIMLFQASSGYYDNLVLLLILAASYSLYYFRETNIYLRSAVAAFLIGFASGSKYFPMIMVPLPILIYLFSQKISWRSLAASLTIMILTMTPLSLWAIRAYIHTGSPVYPFFQSYFPTPKYWVASDQLEDNFMIQTTMSINEWVKGGIFTYPYKSYFNSNQFIEGTRGYPGFIYLAFIPIYIFLLIKSIFQFFKNRRLSSREQLFIYSFLAYFAVGLVVRYYRYLWPFQFMSLLSSLPLLQEYVSHHPKLNKTLIVIFLLIIPLGFINLIDYYRYYPLNKSKTFQANYYLHNFTDQTPMAYINSHATPNDILLDASKFQVHRLHFIPKVYQCSWYWMGWMDDIKNSSVLYKFKYIITTNPISLNSNFCSKLVENAIMGGEYKSVYSDNTYTVYEISSATK